MRRDRLPYLPVLSRLLLTLLMAFPATARDIPTDAGRVRPRRIERIRVAHAAPILHRSSRRDAVEAVAPSVSPGDGFTATVGSDDRWFPGFFPRGFTQTDWECANFTNGPQALVTSGDSIIVGGPFTHAADQAAEGVAVWDGSRWSGLGPDSLALDLRDLTLYHGRVVVGGFRLPDRSGAVVFEWTSNGWQPLGAPTLGGANAAVRVMMVDQGDLIAGGRFEIGDSSQTLCVARWDGSEWSPMGPRLALQRFNDVSALGTYAGALYAGGDFESDAGPDTLRALARWDGTDWQAVPGLAARSWVSALAEHQGELFVAGGLYLATDPTVRHSVARWDGATWTPCDSDFPPGQEGYPGIRSFYTSGTTLWAAGDYHTDFTIEPLLASWSGGGWVDERPPTWSCDGRYFTRIASYRDGFVVVGSFLGIAGSYAGHIAYHDGDGWHPVGPAGQGLDGWVTCFLPGNDGLYVGGTFTQTASGQPLAAIARWDGSQWHALGDGFDGEVDAFAWYGSRLVAGGSFTHSGDVGLSNIAQWDGQRWSPLSEGTSGSVYALQTYNGDLYAGGRFWKIGDQEVANIARWDGSAWRALGLGARGDRYQAVGSLAVYGGSLIVAGDFYQAGAISVPGIARWDGVQWSGVGHPTWGSDTGTAGALVVWNGRLYASGTPDPDTEAGSSLIQWDGFAWTVVAAPMFRDVSALGVYKGNLLVTGLAPDPWAARRELLALWDGKDYSRLASGVDGDWMNAAGVWNGRLYVGGCFRYAGGKPSRNIACYAGSDLVEHPSALRMAAAPNPFTASVTIVVNNPASQRLRLDVIDLLGRRRCSFLDGSHGAGESIFHWDGRDRFGDRLPSGRYFLRMETPSGTTTREMVIAR